MNKVRESFNKKFKPAWGSGEYAFGTNFLERLEEWLREFDEPTILEIKTTTYAEKVAERDAIIASLVRNVADHETAIGDLQQEVIDLYTAISRRETSAI